MKQLIKLGAVAAALWINTACVTITSAVTINADGSTQVHASSIVQEHFLSLLERMGKVRSEIIADMNKSMPSSFTPEAIEALTAVGVTKRSVAQTEEKDGLHWDIDLTFPSVQSLASLKGGVMGSTTPNIVLTDLGDGTWQALMRNDKPKVGDAKMTGDDDSAAVEESPKKKEKKKKKEKEPSTEDQMEILGELMAAMADMKVTVALTVPGEIVSIDPADGTFTGGAATWVIDGEKIQAKLAQGMGGQASEQPTEGSEGAGELAATSPPETEPEEWTVIFRPAAGAKL